MSFGPRPMYSDAATAIPSNAEKHEGLDSEHVGSDEETISLFSNDGEGHTPIKYRPRSKKHRLIRLGLHALPWLLTIIFASLALAIHINYTSSLSCSACNGQDDSSCQAPHVHPSTAHQDASPNHSYRPSSFGSYEHGFDTDLVTNSEIPLERRRFGGSPNFYDNLTAWLDPPDASLAWPDNERYFGTPSHEVDDNWHRLIRDRYFSVSEEEAIRAWGDRRQEYIDERLGGYSAGFDMFHNLHCINTIRKTFYPEYYPRSQRLATVHLEHCLDSIRLSLQCYGSTTLIPTKFRFPLRHNYIDSAQEHTCRSFTFLRDYASSRARGGNAYVPRNQSLINPEKHRLTMEFHEILPENYVDAAT